MMAYRIIQANGIILSDNDDDGETAAGNNLGQLLDVLKAENVVVYVSRWYGGILLGPYRFSVIKNTARIALEESGVIKHR
jgi:putative IMPACT (imprinted ancient) family translation regulator